MQQFRTLRLRGLERLIERPRAATAGLYLSGLCEARLTSALAAGPASGRYM